MDDVKVYQIILWKVNAYFYQQKFQTSTEKKRQHTFLFRLDNLEQEAKMLWQNMNVDDRIRVCVCVACVGATTIK